MKILYTGPCRYGSVTESRRKACSVLGHELVTLDQSPYIDPYGPLLRRLQLHSLIGPGLRRYNRDIVEAARSAKPDLIYVDQAAYLHPKTVAQMAEAAPVVHYTSEHLGFRSYWYRLLRKAAPLFAAHVVTNPLAVPILNSWGARKILMTEFGYDPELHAQPTLSETERSYWVSDAVFVGHWEPETEARISALRSAGVRVSVWGRGWWRARGLADRAHIKPISVADYPKAIFAARVSLCFLSKWNRNATAGRTFEIPAMGGLLLAERTAEHQALFAEGIEAEFFSTTEELISKTLGFLANGERRSAIAERGRTRCLSSGYSDVDRVRNLLAEVSLAVGTPWEK